MATTKNIHADTPSLHHRPHSQLTSTTTSSSLNSKKDSKEELLDEQQQETLIENLKSRNQAIDTQFHHAIFLLTLTLIVILAFHVYALPSLPAFSITQTQHPMPHLMLCIALGFLLCMSYLEWKIHWTVGMETQVEFIATLVKVSTFSSWVLGLHGVFFYIWVIYLNVMENVLKETLFWFTLSGVFLVLRYVLYEMQSVHQSLEQLDTYKYKLKAV
ncbi:hypothetical protein HMI54_001330 [Coelomomyces lativittatus]|nr:hypothetical protein HMI55_000385 [Coelomomyces lativittatus]KAJ1518326.1 hypothetical protein HMI54_001330 [Coelomomyces lativittatus]